MQAAQNPTPTLTFLKRTVSKLLGLSVAGLMLAATGPAAAQTPEKPDVKYALDFAWECYHMVFANAIDGGLYAKEGLTVTMDRGFGSADTIAKVAAKAYDIGLADINVAVKFNAENPGSRVIGVLPVFDRSMIGVVGLKSRGVVKPSDIAGKTIAGSAGEAGRALLPYFARTTGFDLATTKPMTVALNLRETMLVQGKADVTTGFGSTLYFNIKAAGIPADDIAMFLYADYGLPLYGVAVIVREDFAAQNPNTVGAFVRATIASMKQVVKDPVAGIAVLKKRDSLMNEALELERWNFIGPNAVLTDSVKKVGFGYFDRDRLEKSIAGVAEAFEVKNPPTPDQLATNKFLPPQEMRMP